MPMVKTYPMDLVEKIEAELDTVERPKKTELSKKELLERWKPKIKDMNKQRGFSYAEIIQTVLDLSNGEMRFFIPEIEEICSGKRHPEKQPVRTRTRRRNNGADAVPTNEEQTQPSLDEGVPSQTETESIDEY